MSRPVVTARAYGERRWRDVRDTSGGRLARRIVTDLVQIELFDRA